jgi:hypothetical protein
VSLINNDNTPATPTLAELQARFRTGAVEMINGLYHNMTSVYMDLYNAIWFNTTGWTPQVVIDSFGHDAVELFTLAGTLKAVVNGVTPDALPDAPLPFTMNADGTVTVDLPSSASSLSSMSDSELSSLSSEGLSSLP